VLGDHRILVAAAGAKVRHDLPALAPPDFAAA